MMRYDRLLCQNETRTEGVSKGEGKGKGQGEGEGESEGEGRCIRFYFEIMNNVSKMFVYTISINQVNLQSIITIYKINFSFTAQTHTRIYTLRINHKTIANVIQIEKCTISLLSYGLYYFTNGGGL